MQRQVRGFEAGGACEEHVTRAEEYVDWRDALSRVIRRSAAARDLPPSADDTSHTRGQIAVTSTPVKGAKVRVLTFCGVAVDAILTDIRESGEGWIAGARMTDPMQLALLKRAGVPTGPLDEIFTVFDWQLL